MGPETEKTPEPLKPVEASPNKRTFEFGSTQTSQAGQRMTTKHEAIYRLWLKSGVQENIWHQPLDSAQNFENLARQHETAALEAAFIDGDRETMKSISGIDLTYLPKAEASTPAIQSALPDQDLGQTKQASPEAPMDQTPRRRNRLSDWF